MFAVGGGCLGTGGPCLGGDVLLGSLWPSQLAALLKAVQLCYHGR